MATTRTHKVFVSFHHQNDEAYKLRFCAQMGSSFLDKSVEDGDIDLNVQTDTVRQRIRDDCIADATVAAVLIGSCTWQRKHVDWEIGSSLRDTKRNSRCGLLGILLPTHSDHGKRSFRPHLIPPRLADNCGRNGTFAAVYDWPQPWNTSEVQRWIHEAFERRFQQPPPNNARRQFANNRSGPCSSGWSD